MYQTPAATAVRWSNLGRACACVRVYGITSVHGGRDASRPRTFSDHALGCVCMCVFDRVSAKGSEGRKEGNDPNYTARHTFSTHIIYVCILPILMSGVETSCVFEMYTKRRMQHQTCLSSYVLSNYTREQRDGCILFYYNTGAMFERSEIVKNAPTKIIIVIEFSLQNETRIEPLSQRISQTTKRLYL